jgi:hypothetical protein
MESLQTVEEMDQDGSQTGSSQPASTMHLLSVPGPEGPVGPPTPIKDSKFLRRYSCNPGQGKGPHPPHTDGSGSNANSPMPRRSSLAAIKWSVLARRISMGLTHDREPPEDPTKVNGVWISYPNFLVK